MDVGVSGVFEHDLDEPGAFGHRASATHFEGVDEVTEVLDSVQWRIGVAFTKPAKGCRGGTSMGEVVPVVTELIEDIVGSCHVAKFSGTCTSVHAMTGNS